MAVYVIHAEATSLYKVGTAADPVKRLREIQTGCPHHLTLVARIDGGRDVERRIHAALHDKRSRGEWFELEVRPSDETLRELAQHEAPKPSALEPIDPLECDPVGVVEIVDRLGVTRSAFDQWRHRKLDFPEPCWTVGGRPAWNWPDVERWAKNTGRL